MIIDFLTSHGGQATTTTAAPASPVSARARGKRVQVLTGPHDGRHGWDLLTSPGGAQAWSPLAAQVAAFVRAHTLP